MNSGRILDPRSVSGISVKISETYIRNSQFLYLSFFLVSDFLIPVLELFSSCGLLHVVTSRMMESRVETPKKSFANGHWLPKGFKARLDAWLTQMEANLESHLA